MYSCSRHSGEKTVLFVGQKIDLKNISGWPLLYVGTSRRLPLIRYRENTNKNFTDTIFIVFLIWTVVYLQIFVSSLCPRCGTVPYFHRSRTCEGRQQPWTGTSLGWTLGPSLGLSCSRWSGGPASMRLQIANVGTGRDDPHRVVLDPSLGTCTFSP